MRRFLGIVLFCSSLLLVAAAPPSPAPLAAPTTSPAPPPVVTPPPSVETPTVVIYPFDVQTGVDQKIGVAIAQILVQSMTSAGGVDVLTVPSGVTRPNFLTYARAQHADFYISGYVTPVGDGAAVVDQVVSVESGIIVFSRAAQVAGVDDVASKALQERAAIFALIGRDTETIGAQASDTPAPTSSNGSAMQIKGIGGIASIVSSVFGSKHRPGTGSSPLPIVKPARSMIVAPVSSSGSVAGTDVTNASNELFFAMGHFYNVKMTGATPNVEKAANSICGTNRDNTIATGIVSEVPQRHRKTQIVFTLQVYACFGALLAGEVGKGDSIKSAVDSAVAAYATAHPNNG